MRRRDKIKNYEQANMMLEQSYLKSKGLIKEDIFGKDSIAGGKTYVIDIIKTNLKNQIKKNPEQFLISKDGKTVKLNPELEKTIGKWGGKDHHLKDIYKSK